VFVVFVAQDEESYTTQSEPAYGLNMPYWQSSHALPFRPLLCHHTPVCTPSFCSADQHMKKPRDEWEGAALRNSGIPCNNLLPLLAECLPEAAVKRAFERFWNNVARIGGRSEFRQAEAPRARSLPILRVPLTVNATNIAQLMLRHVRVSVMLGSACGGFFWSDFSPALPLLCPSLAGQDAGNVCLRCSPSTCVPLPLFFP